MLDDPDNFWTLAPKFRLCLGEKADEILNAFKRVPRQPGLRIQFLYDFIKSQPEIFPRQMSYEFLVYRNDLYYGFITFFGPNDYVHAPLLRIMRKDCSKILYLKIFSHFLTIYA